MMLLDDTEIIVERRVRYALDLGVRLVTVENVPARVCLETGEQFFAPDTVERLQELIWEQNKPDRIMEVPVFEYTKE